MTALSATGRLARCRRSPMTWIATRAASPSRAASGQDLRTDCRDNRRLRGACRRGVRNMHRVKTLVMLAGAAMLLAGAAQAQIAPKSNAPIDIAADQSEAFTNECRVVWSGDVEALQARTRLRASRLTVFSARKGDGCGATQKLVADGEAERIVRADSAVYLSTGENITLTGNVVVVQGRNVARADRVVIDLATGQSQMISTQKGRASPRRVRGVFYPGAQAN
ncbi:MAG: hypothetical protein EBS42_08575 [Caulobacteraceae bacterium]|nr:hypothetical protein [Caulobacteraceae bacterium]